MDAATYATLRRAARPLARNADEADDLVQDTMLAALAAGRSDARWLTGVLRNLAKMQARGAVRRRAREALCRADAADHAPSEAKNPTLPAMPAASGRIARLALHGLDGDEIRWLLGITPAAFRQRVAGARRAVQALPRARRDAWQAVEPREARADAKLRGVLAAALQTKHGLASHDPDGHPMVLRNSAHVSPPRGNEGAPQRVE